MTILQNRGNCFSLFGTKEELIRLRALCDAAIGMCDMVNEHAAVLERDGLPPEFAVVHPFSDYFGNHKIEIGCEPTIRQKEKR